MRVNGVDLAVSLTGEGRRLIWGHGLLYSMAAEDVADIFDWEQFAESAQVVRYDARGHGLSYASVDAIDYSWPSLAKDMLGIADELELDTVALGGISMGCATALFAALAAPHRVSRLILTTPPTAWETRPPQAALYEQLAAAIDERGMGVLAALYGQQPSNLAPLLLKQASPGLMKQMAAWAMKWNATRVSTILRGAKMSNFPPREELRSLSMPVLILAWEGDAGHPVSTAEQLQSLFPNAHTHIASSLNDLRRWPDLIREFVLA